MFHNRTLQARGVKKFSLFFNTPRIRIIILFGLFVKLVFFLQILRKSFKLRAEKRVIRILLNKHNYNQPNSAFFVAGGRSEGKDSRKSQKCKKKNRKSKK